MPRSLSFAIMMTGAVLGLTRTAAMGQAPEGPEQRYFDPVLSGALCLSNMGGGRQLLSYYQKLAQATETKPFPAPGPSGAATSDNAPLFDDLGTLSDPITTKSAIAQRYFDQGLRLAFGFNHAEAGRAFRTAQKYDPDCAMCAWGEALVLGPNINAPMEAEAVAPAIAAVSRASRNAASASAREQALIAAVAQRYSADPKAERPALDAAYAAAMERLAKEFPADDTIQVLYAESLMDLSPWDYWEAGGAKPKGKTADILASLETVLARNSSHAGAIHYYIHMVEASSAPDRALPYARRLAAQMPGAGHLVHMPFHIYYRVGDYKAAVAANKEAVTIDEDYIAREKPVGIYPLAYYPHNVHSLMASAQMAGDGASAVPAAEKLARIVTADAVRAIPLAQPVAVAQYFAHAQFSAPATVLALAPPPDDLPFVKAMWHYARGVAYAADKNASAARQEAAAIERLKASDFSGLTGASIPAPQILDLARQVVVARIASAEGELPSARAAFEQAVAIQDQLPYTEPPYWYYPVRQSLAATLLRMGELAAAEDAFRASLVQAPNNGWALFGLREVYRRMGRADAAAEIDRRLDEAWAGDRNVLDVSRL
jgi:tetratricopeptide (TPR) repeat protein